MLTDIEALSRYLIQAERRVADGLLDLKRQRELVEELRRDGQDDREAQRLLTSLEEMQAVLVGDQSRLAMKQSRL